MLSPVLHPAEVPVDAGVVHALLVGQRPELADAPVRFVGAGTDNTMYRVGAHLLARLPRSPEHVGALQKELTWLPRLRDRLPCAVPVPVLAGVPSTVFPLPWALFEWIEGQEVAESSIDDWTRYGRDLAGVVEALRGADPMGATSGELQGDRGGVLAPLSAEVAARFASLHAGPADAGVELGILEGRWRAALALPDPVAPLGWLHGDLKPSNVLARDGRLHAVIDFGGLCIGYPDAEHAPTWDLPEEAREAYREALAIDDETWLRARGWAIAIAVTGLDSYRDSFPAFAEECRARLRALSV